MRIPAFRFWFREQAAPVAVQSALALMIGVISIFAAVPLWIVWGLGTVTFAAVLWSWWGSAKAIEASDRREKTIESVLDSMSECLRMRPTKVNFHVYERDVNTRIEAWSADLKKVLTAGQWSSIFRSARDAYSFPGTYANDSHREMVELLNHYRGRLNDVAIFLQ